MVLSFLNEIREKLRIEEIIRTQRFDRRIYILKFPPSSQKKRERELIVEFTYYPFPPLQPFKKVQGLKIDSLFDIGVNKLFAISDRFDPKDFVDLYFIIKKGYPIEKLIKGLKKKMNYEPTIFSLQYQLLNAKKIKTLPRMISKITLPRMVKFFEKQVEILSSLLKREDN